MLHYIVILCYTIVLHYIRFCYYIVLHYHCIVSHCIIVNVIDGGRRSAGSSAETTALRVAVARSPLRAQTKHTSGLLPTPPPFDRRPPFLRIVCLQYYVMLSSLMFSPSKHVATAATTLSRRTHFAARIWRLKSSPIAALGLIDLAPARTAFARRTQGGPSHCRAPIRSGPHCIAYMRPLLRRRCREDEEPNREPRHRPRTISSSSAMITTLPGSTALQALQEAARGAEGEARGGHGLLPLLVLPSPPSCPWRRSTSTRRQVLRRGVEGLGVVEGAPLHVLQHALQGVDVDDPDGTVDSRDLGVDGTVNSRAAMESS